MQDAQTPGGQIPGGLPTPTKPSHFLDQISAINPAVSEKMRGQFKYFRKIHEDPASSPLRRKAAAKNLGGLLGQANEFLAGDEAVAFREDGMRGDIDRWAEWEGNTGAPSTIAQGEDTKTLTGDKLRARWLGAKRRRNDVVFYQNLGQHVVADTTNRLQILGDLSGKDNEKKQETMSNLVAKVRDGIPWNLTGRDGARQWAESIDTTLDELERSPKTNAHIANQLQDFNDQMKRVDAATQRTYEIARRLAEKGPDYDIHTALRETPFEAIPLIRDPDVRDMAMSNAESLAILVQAKLGPTVDRGTPKWNAAVKEAMSNMGTGADLTDPDFTARLISEFKPVNFQSMMQGGLDRLKHVKRLTEIPY